MKFVLRCISRECTSNANEISFSTREIHFLFHRIHVLFCFYSRKKQIHMNIHNIERKCCIKYLHFIYLDKQLNWKSKIAHVNCKLTKNIGIFYKLRHCLDIHMLKHLCYTFIYPYLSYGAMSWGNTYIKLQQQQQSFYGRFPRLQVDRPVASHRSFLHFSRSSHI